MRPKRVRIPIIHRQGALPCPNRRNTMASAKKPAASGASKKPSGSPKKTAPAPKKASAPATAKKTAGTVKKASAAKAAPAPAASKATPSRFAAPRENVWAVQLKGVAENLKKRGFGASVVSSVADAAALVMQKLLPESNAKVVSFGGSMTVLEGGLLDAMKAQKGLEVIDTFDMSIGMPAVLERRRQALLSDFYLCSANALTRDGVVMLIDGIGNRTAAVQFGPRKVVLLVGRNKICDSIEAGFHRVKTMAAPANAMRLSKKTPCATTGYCMDCKSPDRICSTWTITTRCFPAGRIHVVLIDQEVGF